MPNQVAIDFIKAREKCRLDAYQDSGGRWTVGWGATGPGIVEGTIWTQEQADADLANRIAPLESHLAAVTVLKVKLTVQQSAALISFAYNCGEHALETSHLLQFVLKKNWIAAAKAFLEWDHDNGTELQGLLKRRMEEAALFLEGST